MAENSSCKFTREKERKKKREELLLNGGMRMQ
jgi:hypothetical protein